MVVPHFQCPVRSLGNVFLSDDLRQLVVQFLSFVKSLVRIRILVSHGSRSVGVTVYIVCREACRFCRMCELDRAADAVVFGRVQVSLQELAYAKAFKADAHTVFVGGFCRCAYVPTIKRSFC